MNEATVQCGLTIKLAHLNYASPTNSFRATVLEGTGPTPGNVLVTTAGTDISLAQLTTPGLCRIQNLDPTNYVEYGVWDPETLKFYPLGELLPGEANVVRLSRNFGIEWESTGTGTSPATNRLRCKANTAPCRVLVEAFGA